MNSLIQPQFGYRTYTVYFLSLLAGLAVGITGILAHADLVGLAAIVVAILGPTIGFSTWNNVATPVYPPTAAERKKNG
jgi:hypothetical protein